MKVETKLVTIGLAAITAYLVTKIKNPPSGG